MSNPAKKRGPYGAKEVSKKTKLTSEWLRPQKNKKETAPAHF